MNIVGLSQLLIVLFVGSVTLWYCITPYIINPHPGIVNDVLTKTKLAAQKVGGGGGGGPSQISVENWTKWRIYVNASGKEEAADGQVIFGNSKADFDLERAAVMRMEWRDEYEIHVSRQQNEKGLDVERRAPAAGDYGIYDHFVATAAEASSSVVRVVPRFLFGLPFDTIAEMYGDDVSNFPVIGVFSDSPGFDRIIIQAYMNVVTLSVIFLLYANNPPHAIATGGGASKKRS